MSKPAINAWARRKSPSKRNPRRTSNITRSGTTMRHSPACSSVASWSAADDWVPLKKSIQTPESATSTTRPGAGCRRWWDARFLHHKRWSGEHGARGRRIPARGIPPFPGQLAAPLQHFAIVRLAGKQPQPSFNSLPLSLEGASRERLLHECVIDIDICAHCVCFVNTVCIVLKRESSVSSITIGPCPIDCPPR